MRKSVCVTALASLLLFSCTKKATEMKSGTWRAELTLSDSLQNLPKPLLNEKGHLVLPFNFNFDFSTSGKPTITIINGEEKIVVDEVHIAGDSIHFHLPYFDSEVKARIINDTTISGNFYNHSRKNKNVLPFSATLGSERFISQKPAAYDFSGKWEVTFSPGTQDSYKAIGEFQQKGNHLNGTFLTETGDYRYLDGIAEGNHFYLSAFDGSHAFLFDAEITGDSINGNFWSGMHWHEPFTAKRNDKFELANPESLTFVKQEAGNIDFTYPDLNNRPVSLSDPRFLGKVVVIQIMGSWCPNCMDETRLLQELYEDYHTQGLEIIALAYEKSKDFNVAAKNVNRFKERLGAKYDFLITGKSGKDEASESLPFLNGIMSFPTTIFIDRNGNVSKIQTGFNGPATGKHYEKQANETRETIIRLLTIIESSRQQLRNIGK
jgi:thiol-disulfide isomerase/thioredoxin